jgi:hypothetical protein
MMMTETPEVTQSDTLDPDLSFDSDMEIDAEEYTRIMHRVNDDEVTQVSAFNSSI